MKIVIYSPSYEESSGGITVLHKLCDVLIQCGFNAGFYLNKGESFNVNSKFKYQGFYLGDLNLENDIIVYPEITFGNPLGFKKVVRYILNVGHVTLNRKDTWGEFDYWIYFSERFYDGIKPKVILSVIDSKIDYFKNYNIPRPYKECFTYRKGKDNLSSLNIIHSPDAIEIDFNQSDEYLINVFNMCERFYCYDTESYLNILASLCGCDSVIVPSKNSDRDKIINQQPPFKYGVAYGIDEIESARKTRPLLYNYLKEKENTQILETKNAFDNIIEFFQTK